MVHPGPLLVVLAPVLAVAPLWFMARRRRVLGTLTALVATATFAGVAALAPLVLAHGRITTTLPAALGEMRFTLDGVGLIFALATGLVWGAASWYATGYLPEDRRGPRYHATSLVTLSAMLGVVTAGDLMTLYVFFEWLGLTAYLFVVHVGGRDAERAGVKYLVLTLLGGFAVLVGSLIVYALGGGDLSTPVPLEAGREGVRSAAAAFLVLGFGVKAGALGLHLWLPDAHTAAPAPASALLSGVMIKAGAYGILRTVATLFGGGDGVGADGPALALAVVWWGAATMLVGAVMAFCQTHAKRVLAYSSVSQMGFVLVGIGVAACLKETGAIGWTGTLLHVVNHALAKGLLFLGIGAVIHATGEPDLRRLGGLAGRMPWTFAVVLVAAGGIAGVPGLNGFVSKSVLHHAVDHAALHGAGLVWVERVFVLATVGTAAVLIKLVALAFLGRPRGTTPRPAAEVGWRMRGPMLLLAATALALGVVPTLATPLVEGGVAPLVDATGGGVVEGEAAISAWLAGPLRHAGDLRAALAALLLGGLVHVAALRAGAYARVVPGWLSLDRMATAAATALVAFGRRWAGLPAHWSTSLGAWVVHERAVVRRAAVRPRVALRMAGPRARNAALAVGRWAALRSTAVERLVARFDATRWLAEPAASTDPPTTAEPTAVSERDRWVRATRQRIARHGRDLSLGAAVMFLLWLGFVAVVAFGR